MFLRHYFDLHDVFCNDFAKMNEIIHRATVLDECLSQIKLCFVAITTAITSDFNLILKYRLVYVPFDICNFFDHCFNFIFTVSSLLSNTKDSLVIREAEKVR